MVLELERYGGKPKPNIQGIPFNAYQSSMPVSLFIDVKWLGCVHLLGYDTYKKSKSGVRICFMKK